jgi:maleylpyruvate isomerase
MSLSALPGRPTSDILLALRGTAYFLRWLSLIHEEDYDAPGDPGAGRSRRQTIATVGYQARGYARLAEESRLGLPSPRTFDSRKEHDETVSLGSTLPARALRFLVEHSAVHLSVEWRDLPDDSWDSEGRDAAGRPVTPADTAWRRARGVWIAAVDLGNGGSFVDFPRPMLERLIGDRVAELTATGTPSTFDPSDSAATVRRGGDVATGQRADLARWLYGRGDRNLSVNGEMQD